MGLISFSRLQKKASRLSLFNPDIPSDSKNSIDATATARPSCDSNNNNNTSTYSSETLRKRPSRLSLFIFDNTPSSPASATPRSSFSEDTVRRRASRRSFFPRNHSETEVLAGDCDTDAETLVDSEATPTRHRCDSLPVTPTSTRSRRRSLFIDIGNSLNRNRRESISKDSISSPVQCASPSPSPSLSLSPSKSPVTDEKYRYRRVSMLVSSHPRPACHQQAPNPATNMMMPSREQQQQQQQQKQRGMQHRAAPTARAMPMACSLPLQLPPGAMAPAINGPFGPGRVRYQAMPRQSFEDTVFGGSSSGAKPQPHLESRSLGAASGRRMTAYGTPSTMSSSSRPNVPPRSHLRSLASTSSSAASSATGCSSTPTSSGRSSPLPPSNTTVPAAMTRRQFVLEVAQPPPAMHTDFRPAAPKRSSLQAAEDIITFGHKSRASRHKAQKSLDERDPLKVRDGVSAHKARSGVYTPASFPGATGHSPTSPMTATFDRQRMPGNPNAVAARSQTMPRFTAPPPLPPRATSLPVKRNSAPGPTNSSQQRAQYAIAMPERNSFHTHQYRQALQPPLPVAAAAAPAAAQAPVYTHAKRPSYSPSSAHSAASLSPPGTPTTPTSASHHGSGSSRPASSSITIVPADAAPHFGGRTPPSDGADTDAVVAPKGKAAESAIGLSLTHVPPPTIPAAAEDVPLSPGAPKRARRKPVPRLDPDLELVQRMESL